jgi:hypothetical protein
MVLIGLVRFVSFRLFKCLIPIESICDIILVFKDVENVILELKFDNGTVINLEKSEKDVTVRHWRRKYE